MEFLPSLPYAAAGALLRWHSKRQYSCSIFVVYFLGLRDDGHNMGGLCVGEKNDVFCKFATQWNSLPLVFFLSWKARLQKCQLADMKFGQLIANCIS